MNKQKIFIEIDIPPKVKKRLMQSIVDWSELPIKWSREANLHITVAFLGFVDEEMVPEICAKVAEAAQKSDTFDIMLEKISLAPSAEEPTMIWVQGQESEEMKELVENVEKSLGMFRASRKQFVPHITLGRIRADKWNELAEKPLIEKNFSISIPVEKVLVMSSKNKGEEGSEYSVLESCSLA